MHEPGSPLKLRGFASLARETALDHPANQDSWCTHPQSQERLRRPAARQTDRHHGPLRLGKVFAGLRHAVRGRSAPLRGIAVGLRASVPLDDGQARCGQHRRPLTCHRDRTEGDLSQSAFHRRHGHRDLRLSTPAVRARRHRALPGSRHRSRGADREPDGGPDPQDARRTGGPAARASGHRSQGRTRRSVRAAPWPGLRARAHRWPRARARCVAEHRRQEETHRRGGGR